MRTFLQLLAMTVSQIFSSPFTHSSGHRSRPGVGVFQLFYAIKSYVKRTVGSEIVIHPALVIAYTHILSSRLFSVSSVCFQFSFVFLVWFTDFISLVLPCFSGKTLQWPQSHTCPLTFCDVIIWAVFSPQSSLDCICTRQLTSSWKECLEYLDVTLKIFPPHNWVIKKTTPSFRFPRKINFTPSWKWGCSKWLGVSQTLSYVSV